MSNLTPLAAPAVCHEFQISEEDWLQADREDLVRMLFLLYLIRDFETAVLDLKDADLVHGPAHTSIGQEAIAAATAVVLRKGDRLGSTHRAHGHFLAKAFMYYAPDGYYPLRHGVTSKLQEIVTKTLAEIMGLKEGWCGGRGGSMHLYDGESGNLGSNAIVGGGIPLATGAAWAEKLRNRDSVVVSFFGDGAMNQGCFHEVANMAALWNVPVLYFVENNFYAVGTKVSQSSHVPDLGQRSISYGISSLIVDGMNPLSVYLALRRVIANMRQRPFPFFIEGKTYRLYHHAGRLAGSSFGYRSKEEEQAWIERDPILVFPRKLAHLGVITSADDERLKALAREAVDQALAYCTEMHEGKRVIPPARWPAPESVLRGVRDETDRLAGEAFKEREDFSEFKTMSYVEAIAGVTLRAMERDDRVIVLGEEVANLRGGAYGATRGIKEVYPERLFNTPISETGFVGMAGGAAAVGMRPVVEIMFPDFGLMASDQLFNQIGKLRHMYGGRISFPLLLRTRVAIGYGYGGQHSMNPASLFAQFSGWRVVAPSNAFDYIGLFNTAMRLHDPVLIIEHGLLYADKDQVPAHDMDYLVAYGKARVLRQGSDVTVLTYLMGVGACLRAAEELAAQGISAEVIDLRTLDYTGMDYRTIEESLKKTGSLLIVEQGTRSLTLGPRLAAELQERCFDYLDCPIRQVASPDVPSPVSRKLEEAFIPSYEMIKDAMLRGGRHQ